MKATITEEFVLRTKCPRCGSPERIPISGRVPGTDIGPLSCGQCGGVITGHITDDGAAEIETAPPEGKGYWSGRGRTAGEIAKMGIW